LRTGLACGSLSTTGPGNSATPTVAELNAFRARAALEPAIQPHHQGQ
jgi:hypothetical protein